MNDDIRIIEHFLKQAQCLCSCDACKAVYAAWERLLEKFLDDER